MSKMARLKVLATRVLKDEEGATVVEYSLLIALVAAASVVSMVFVGHLLQGVFERLKWDLVSNVQ
jgi:Flp pilus assembly pilin Flp